MSCQRIPSLGNLLLAFAVAAAVGFPTASATAQKAAMSIPPAISPDPLEPDLMQPFVDPFAFESDFQYFSPVQLSTYGGPQSVNVGWYFGYGREYVNMSMPEQNTVEGDIFARPFDGEWIWGNRYDMGYMTEEDHGWNLTYSHLSTGLLIDNDNDLEISLKPRYHSVELSKTFRKNLRYGGQLEPFFGVRYIYFSDTFIDVSPAGQGTSVFSQKMQNQMIGGQIGCRYHVRKGRWNLSANAKIVATENFQFANVHETDSQPGILLISDQNESYDEFVPLGELRGEACYELTRDISLRFGCGLTHIVRGILRANTAPFELNLNNPNRFPPPIVAVNDQDLTMAGFTFGIEINR